MTDHITLPPVQKRTLQIAAHLAGYGAFMTAWSGFEQVLELIIHSETGVSPVHATILVSGLGFERKASITRCLLALHGDKHKAAISLINSIINTAERNALVHGLIETIGPAATCTGFRFLKRNTDQSLKVSSREFSNTELFRKAQKLAEQIDELATLVGVTDDHLIDWAKTARNLASNVATSPNPPSSAIAP